MALKLKRKVQQHRQRPPRPGPKPIPDPARLESDIQALLEAGKTRRALEVAKGHYRRTGTGEALLQQAYAARLDSLLQQARLDEAQAMLGQVRSEHPAWQRVGADIECRLAARAGRWEALLPALLDPTRRALIEEAIRRELVDLSTLASLPGEHPLKVAGAALEEAFRQVTSTGSHGPLPELSRRSPLAPWRLLIQAIGCYHQGQDEACERFLAAIPAGSAPARLVAPLRAALADAGEGFLAGDRGALRAGLAALEQALAQKRWDAAFSQMEPVIKRAQQVYPEGAERLRQRILHRCQMLDLPAARVQKYAGGSVRADSSFWQMLARQAEEQARPPQETAMLWQEFRQQARTEGNLSPCEESLLLTHLARLVADQPALPTRVCQSIQSLYQGQPEAIRSASLLGRGARPPRDYLDPLPMFQRACSLDPHPQTFEAWLAYESDRPGGRPERAAEAWRQFHPGDIRPVLALVELLEEKGAFQKALKYVAAAQQLDRVDPRLEQIRWRLEVGAALSHLRSKQGHLVRSDLERLEASSAMQKEDRPLLLAALRCLEGLVTAKPRASEEELARLGKALGSRMAASLLVESVAHSSRLQKLCKPGPSIPSGAELAALVRLHKLTEEFGVLLQVDPHWETLLLSQLTESLPVETLRSLAELALDHALWQLAFRASGLGLNRPGPSQGRFLFLRAQVLQGRRADDCLGAAATLARQHGDQTLLSEITEYAGEPQEPMSARLLAMVLELEQKSSGRPEPCQCPRCRAGDLTMEELLDLFELPGGRQKRRSS